MDEYQVHKPSKAFIYWIYFFSYNNSNVFLTLSKVDGLYSIQTTVPFISCIYELMNYEQKFLNSDVNNSTNINKMNNNLSSQLIEHKKIP